MEPSQGYDLQQMAYLMWEADGCPHDCGDRYWRKAVALDTARRELEATAQPTAGPTASMPDADAPHRSETPTASRASVSDLGAAAAPVQAEDPASSDQSAGRGTAACGEAPLDSTFGWFELARAQIACAVTGLSRLADCRTLEDVAARQSELLTESLQITVDHGLRLVDRAQAAIAPTRR